MNRLARWVMLAVGLSLAAGCAAQPTPTLTPTLMPTATHTPMPTLTPTPLPSPTPMPPVFRIVGYATDATVVGVIPFDRLTHINYAFLIPNADGTFAAFANTWKLDDLAAQAHAHGVQVLISVGGWGWDAQFEALAADPARRAVFVADLVAFVAQHNLDGADVDWEYPDPGASAQNFLALMTELRAALPPDKLLTAAVAALGGNADGIPTESFALMDFINLMVYDGDGPQHSSLQYADEALAYWAGRGLPPEQTVLGVPFYAHPNWMTYKKLVEADLAAAEVDEFDYYGIKVNYNGRPTIQQKTRLAQQRASGVMIWALDFDTRDPQTSLLTAIYDASHQGQQP